MYYTGLGDRWTEHISINDVGPKEESGKWIIGWRGGRERWNNVEREEGEGRREGGEEEGGEEGGEEEGGEEEGGEEGGELTTRYEVKDYKAEGVILQPEMHVCV